MLLFFLLQFFSPSKESQSQSSGAEQRSMAFSSLCYPCEDSILKTGDLLERVPYVTVKDALSRIFPAARGSGLLEGEAQLLVQSVLESGGGCGGCGGSTTTLLLLSAEDDAPKRIVDRLTAGTSTSTSTAALENRRNVLLRFQGHDDVAIHCMGGPYPSRFPLEEGEGLLPHQALVLSGMLQSASVGSDVCLIGAR